MFFLCFFFAAAQTHAHAHTNETQTCADLREPEHAPSVPQIDGACSVAQMERATEDDLPYGCALRICSLLPLCSFSLCISKELSILPRPLLHALPSCLQTPVSLARTTTATACNRCEEAFDGLEPAPKPDLARSLSKVDRPARKPLTNATGSTPEFAVAQARDTCV
eukprot:6208118-Pleurochrysis_carterae.AAC.1